MEKGANPTPLPRPPLKAARKDARTHARVQHAEVHAWPGWGAAWGCRRGEKVGQGCAGPATAGAGPGFRAFSGPCSIIMSAPYEGGLGGHESSILRPTGRGRWGGRFRGRGVTRPTEKPIGGQVRPRMRGARRAVGNRVSGATRVWEGGGKVGWELGGKKGSKGSWRVGRRRGGSTAPTRPNKPLGWEVGLGHLPGHRGRT